MKRLFDFLLVAFVFLLIVFPRDALAELRSYDWGYGGTDLDYNLQDDDNFYFGKFHYCEWGNFQDYKDHKESGLFFLNYTKMTLNIRDLFLNHDSAHLGFIEFPSGGFVDGNFGTDSQIQIHDDTREELALFRYYQFNTKIWNFTQKKNLTKESDIENFIVLIHGWNPDSKENHLDGEFGQIEAYINERIKRTDNKTWEVLGYRWEADADTGPPISPFKFDDTFLANSTEAAIAAHFHGQNLGAVMRAHQSDLKKVHLIAHSAGAWAARSAAQHILKRQPNVKIQITLLDPFIPSDLPGNTTPLSSNEMGRLPSLDDNLNNGSSISKLENYYANDHETDYFFTNYPTSGAFGWFEGIEKKIDYGILPQTYSYHAGPVQFYADTILDVMGEGSSTRLSDAPYYKDGENLGWPQSMFEREVNSPPKPSIVSSPSPASVQVGESVTFTATVSEPSSVSIIWKKKLADGNVVSDLPGGASTPTGSTLTLMGVTLADAAEYFVVVSNIHGDTISDMIELHVTEGAGSPSIQRNPQSMAVAVGATATFSVLADGADPLTYSWLENGAAISGATSSSYTTPATSFADSGSIYSVVVSNPQGPDATSAGATLTVTEAGGGLPPGNDDNEPNDSSLAATSIASGDMKPGYVSSPTDVDWFQVQVTEPGTLKYHLALPGGHDYDLELYGPSGSFVKGSYNVAGTDEVIEHYTTQTGTWLVRVYGYPTGNGSYNAALPYVLSYNFLPLGNGTGDFGTRDVNHGYWKQSYTLVNTSNQVVNLTGDPLVQITGGDASDFTVVQQPDALIQPGETTMLTVQFKPSATGQRTSQLHVPTDSSDIGTFTKLLSGRGETRTEIELGDTTNPGEIHSRSGVIFSSVTLVAGTLRLSGDLEIRGNLRFENNSVLDIRSENAALDLNGYNLIVTGTMYSGIKFSIPSGKKLEVGEHLIHMWETINVNGGQIIVNGDYRKQELLSSGTWQYGWEWLKMQNPNDYVLVKGDFYWDNARNDTGWMTDGILELRGNFTQLSTFTKYPDEDNANEGFKPRGNHRVILSGSQEQRIYFTDAKGTDWQDCYFNILDSRNASTGGVVCVSEINTSQLSGRGGYRNLNLLGGSITVADDFIVRGDMKVRANLDLNAQSVEVLGNMEHVSGILNVNGGRLLIRGDYRKQELLSDGTWQYGWEWLQMQNPNDYVLVEGDFYWDNARNDTGWMTDGILELRGDFTQLSTFTKYPDEDNANEGFKPRGNHSVILSGSQEQRIYFTDAKGTDWQDCYFNILDSRNSVMTSFEDQTRITKLFQHRRNPFTLHASALDTDFNDYDSDGLRDHLDPFPEVAGFQTDANGNGIPDDVTQENYTYDAWKALHFSQGSPNYAWDSAYLNDYEKGGLPNIFEYLHGFNPHVVELSPVIHYIARSVIDNEDYWAMEFPVVRATLGTVEYYGEGSDDMLTWTRLSRLPHVISSEDEIDTIRVMDDVKIPSKQKRFLRLVVKPIIEP